MIDPQGQANRWLRNMYASKNLQIIKLTEKVRSLAICFHFIFHKRNVYQNIISGLSPNSRKWNSIWRPCVAGKHRTRARSISGACSAEASVQAFRADVATSRRYRRSLQ